MNLDQFAQGLTTGLVWKGLWKILDAARNAASITENFVSTIDIENYCTMSY